MKTRGILAIGALLAALALSAEVRAETVAFRDSTAEVNVNESVAELSRRGKHFEAMAKYTSADGQASLADQLGAAKSAWALGLVPRSRQIWDEILADENFQGDERSRTALARAIVELQEANFEEARSIAERAAATLDTSDLRAQFWLVIAEALKEQNANSLAEGYYKKAIHDGSAELQTEARFLLGECQRRLGMMNEARYSFASVEAGSVYTVQALRRLIEIDLQQRNYEGVLTWVQEGRDSYPGEFKEGWSSYAYVSALTALGRNEEAKKELHELRMRRAESDPWYSLAEALVESKLVEGIYPDTSAAPQTSAKRGAQ